MKKKSPDRMEYLHIRLPRAVIEALDTVALEESKATGFDVNRSMVVRKLLENSLQNRPQRPSKKPPRPEPLPRRERTPKQAAPKRRTPPKPSAPKEGVRSVEWNPSTREIKKVH